MALTLNHPTLKEVQVGCHSPSIASTPVVAYARAPFRGSINKVVAVTGGAVTTADATIVVKVGTTTVTTSTFAVTSGSAAGTAFTATPSAGAAVNEDDVISFSASGGTGVSVPGTFYAVVQMG